MNDRNRLLDRVFELVNTTGKAYLIGESGRATRQLDFDETQRFYNAGYAAGQRAMTDAMLVWLDTGPDQGDEEFAWKAAVRAALHSQETLEAAAISEPVAR